MPIIIDPRTGLPYPVRTDRAPRSRRQGRVPGPADVAKIDAQVLRDPGVHATPADFGAGIGKAIEQFGAAASRVAADFATMRREAEDDTAAAAGLSEARVRFTRIARSMETQATTTEGLTGNLGKALSEETDAILRDLREVRGFRPSKGGEATIRRQLGLLASRMVARGAMSEHRIRLAKLGHDVDFSVADAAMAAFDAPGDVFAIIAETEASLAKFKDKLPPDILAAKVAAAREMIAGNAVAGLVEQGDVATARTLLEAAGTGDGVSLSPDQADRLRAAVDRVEDQARRARRPAAEAEIEDHLASIQATGAGLGVTERARAALDGKAFKVFQRNEKDAHAFHETMESLKFARPDVIDRELESRRPRKGARNFEDKQRRFRVLERGAKQLLNVRARDGAAVVMEMGDVKAAFERAGDDGPSLRRALKFRMAMQADIGMPEDRVRLLTRAEAGALASEVQSAATQDKAAKVAGLQDLYGPLFGRAMKELSQAGLNPRYRALAGARDNPVLARTLAEAIEAGGAEVEKDAAKTQEIRDGVRDAAADTASTAQPGGETAEGIEAIRSAAEDLGVQYFRQTGRKDESIRRAAAFANGAIEEVRLSGSDDEADVTGAGEDDELASGGGDDTLTGDDTPTGGGPGDDTPDKDVTEDELIERIAALSEEVLDLAETGRQEAGAEDEPLVMANINVLLKILRSLGNLLGRKGGQEAAREGVKGAVGKLVEQLARKAGRRIQRKILDQSRRTGKGAGRQGKDREAGGLAKDIVPVATEAVVAAVRAKLQKRSEERARAGRKGSVKKIDLEPSDFEPGATAAGAIQGLGPVDN